MVLLGGNAEKSIVENDYGTTSETYHPTTWEWVGGDKGLRKIDPSKTSDNSGYSSDA